MPRKKKVETTIKTEPDIPSPKEKIYFVDRAMLTKKGSDLNPEPHDVYKQAASLVQSEKTTYEDGSKAIKDTLKRCVKNYLGIFDEPYDPYTNRKKIFTPLTHTIVDSVSKPVKIESRSIRILPMTDESRGAAKLLNMVLPYFFQQMDFDTMMKLFVHRVGWLGHQVTIQDWLYEEGETAKSNEPTTTQKKGYALHEKQDNSTKDVKTDRPRIRLVDVMDIFTSATAESLPWAVKNASVILRSVVPLSDVLANPAYSDEVKSNLQGFISNTQDRNDSSFNEQYSLAGYQNNSTKTTHTATLRTVNPFVSIYERYGQIPKSWITGDKADGMINIPGIVTCVANESNGGTMQTLCVRVSPFGEYGPFEEACFNKLPNRWAGEGLAERIIPLQSWQNEVVNNRRNNEILVQHRQFLYKKGKVDPRYFFSRPGGGIPVEDMTDVQALTFQDVSQSSFVEDQSIESLAQRMAGAALTPVQKKVTATEAASIQSNSNLTYSELRDTIESYMQRLVNNHLIPLLKRYFRQKKVIPIKLPIGELMELDTYNGYSPFLTEKLGEERFLFVDDPSVFDGEFAVTVDIEFAPNRTQQVQTLTNLMAMSAKIQDSGFNFKAAFKKIAELQGIFDDRLFQDATTAAPTGVTNPIQMMQQAPPTAQQNIQDMLGQMPA